MTDRKRLLDTEAVAAHYRRATGTVRYWASVHGWTKYGSRRHRLWDLEEIQDKFDEHERQQRMTNPQELLAGVVVAGTREPRVWRSLDDPEPEIGVWVARPDGVHLGHCDDDLWRLNIAWEDDQGYAWDEVADDFPLVEVFGRDEERAASMLKDLQGFVDE